MKVSQLTKTSSNYVGTPKSIDPLSNTKEFIPKKQIKQHEKTSTISEKF